MGKVRDLTTDSLGKVWRIQNDDGAFIEGTLDSVTFGLVGESKTPEVIVTFKELMTSYKDGSVRKHIHIFTRPQHIAEEVVEEYTDPWKPSPPPVDGEWKEDMGA